MFCFISEGSERGERGERLLLYHEVEASHEENQVYQQQPMTFQRHFAFSNERPPDISTLVPDELTLLERIGFWQTETEDDEQNRRAGTEPIQRTPAVRRSIDKTPRKCCRQKVPKSVSLLQHTRNNTTCRMRAVLQSRRGGITIQTTHRDTEQRSTGQELLVGLAEARAELQRDEEDVVHYERPFPSVAIGGHTEDDGADRSEHQDECDAP